MPIDWQQSYPNRTVESAVMLSGIKEKLKLKKVNLIGSIINDKNNPSLLTELQRETYRLNRLFPNVMAKLRKSLLV